MGKEEERQRMFRLVGSPGTAAGFAEESPTDAPPRRSSVQTATEAASPPADRRRPRQLRLSAPSCGGCRVGGGM